MEPSVFFCCARCLGSLRCRHHVVSLILIVFSGVWFGKKQECYLPFLLCSLLCLCHYPATLFSYSICYYLFCAASLDDTIFVLCLTCYPFYQLGILGGLYSGGSAQMVEKSLDIHGDEILYVGDHIYTDVSQSKVHLRWRTALICRELEDEVCLLTFSHYFCLRYFSYHIIYF
jgi:hypothetical protein